MKNLILRTLKIQDKPLVRKHLEEYFIKVTPLYYATEWANTTGDHEELMEIETAPIDQGYSHGYFTPDGELVSMFLNDLEVKNVKKPILKYQNKQTQVVYGFLEHQHAQYNLFEKFNADKILQGSLVSTDPRYQNLGLAAKLRRESVITARSLGAKLMSAEAITVSGQAFSMGLGYKIAYESNVKDYVDEKGEMLIKLRNPDLKYQAIYQIVP